MTFPPCSRARMNCSTWSAGARRRVPCWVPVFCGGCLGPSACRARAVVIAQAKGFATGGARLKPSVTVSPKACGVTPSPRAASRSGWLGFVVWHPARRISKHACPAKVAPSEISGACCGVSGVEGNGDGDGFGDGALPDGAGRVPLAPSGTTSGKPLALSGTASGKRRAYSGIIRAASWRPYCLHSAAHRAFSERC